MNEQMNLTEDTMEAVAEVAEKSNSPIGYIVSFGVGVITGIFGPKIIKATVNGVKGLIGKKETNETTSDDVNNEETSEE